MLLWRNGADPTNSYKLGEKDVFPVDVENNCPIVTLLLSKYSFTEFFFMQAYCKYSVCPTLLNDFFTFKIIYYANHLVTF